MKSAALLMVLVCAFILVSCHSKQSAHQPDSKTGPAPTRQATTPNDVDEVQEAIENLTMELAENVATVDRTGSTKVEQKSIERFSKVKTQPKSIPPLPGLEAVPKVSPPRTGPEFVVYHASQGSVTFPHADHAGRLACSQCHVTEPPGRMVIDKTYAHNTCKGCHKNSGSGPTGCLQCHIK